ncbi:AGL156Wp [Eremothecium gossypii ATCC 10895]|uniref:AGL156Wp n=1 Tax=Eremothecium gossypii (strain ATCC 10895 / CBS 109.51 / FGSC 9923 / NRRL Y-1056) TaxID=284811 RepID=Q750U5_EREGS|nr:AGL156Wp [Eremothecium gossypii ATCC 10895]AAS54335.1 AGL156Wp [Eremothecium gossypii ATCC 10895]AEY98662.1 FAGL156Wp [Eremothecium gossypii FDAG1]
MKVQIEHVSLSFIKEINNNICSLQVQNNVMCFALESGQLFLINLAEPSNVVEFRVSLLNLNQEKVVQLWMNTQGTRALIKTNFSKYFVCNVGQLLEGGANDRRNPVCATLKKLNRKECDIVSVDWSFSELELLVGTRQGKLYYLDLRHGEPAPVRIYMSQTPIEGIKWSHENGAMAVSGSTIQYWESVPGQTAAAFTRMPPKESEEFEPLKKTSGTRFTAHNSTFAWVTQAGIVFGNTKTSPVLSSAKLLLNIELPPSNSHIKDIKLTDYHLILLRGSEVIVINQLNNNIVFQEVIFSKENERMLALCADYSQSPPTFWCHSTENVYELVVENETEGIWQLLCANGQFMAALNLKGLSEPETDFIREQYANKLYNEGKWLEAAKEYGTSGQGSSIGSIALKFMEFDDLIHLQTFLMEKLKSILQKANKIQVFIMTSWIIWNFMNQLNRAEEIIAEEATDTNLDELKNAKAKLESQFQEFVRTHVEYLDRDTVYQIVSQQNRKAELLFYANIIEDYRYVLCYWIRSDNWYESLKILVTLKDPECVYQYATVLLINAPDATVNTWVQIPNVDPVKLVPSMLTYFSHYQDQQRFSHRMLPNYALTYLKFCIKEYNCQESLIHNTAIYMLLVSIAEDDVDGEHDVIKFMNDHATRFDPNFILRLALKLRRYSVAIHLYSQLKLYDNAVDLALSKDMLSSAKVIVGSLETEDTYMLKRLWLKIARVTIYEDTDVRQSIRSIIQDANGVLTIKDLLPLVSKVATIANLKEELVRSLENHQMSMSHIFQEISDSIKIKREIRQDIELFNKRRQALQPGAGCDSCREVLQTRKFFVFPCGHNFHTDCMIKEIIQSNDFNLRSQIESFQRKLARKQPVDADKLDHLLSTKCCLCSDLKINTIDEPLPDLAADTSGDWDL